MLEACMLEACFDICASSPSWRLTESGIWTLDCLSFRMLFGWTCKHRVLLFGYQQCWLFYLHILCDNDMHDISIVYRSSVQRCTMLLSEIGVNCSQSSLVIWTANQRRPAATFHHGSRRCMVQQIDNIDVQASINYNYDVNLHAISRIYVQQ